MALQRASGLVLPTLLDNYRKTSAQNRTARAPAVFAEAFSKKCDAGSLIVQLELASEYRKPLVQAILTKPQLNKLVSPPKK